MKKWGLILKPNLLRNYLEERVYLNNYAVSDIPKHILKKYFQYFEKNGMDGEYISKMILGSKELLKEIEKICGSYAHIFTTPGNIIIFEKRPKNALKILRHERMHREFDFLDEKEKSYLIKTYKKIHDKSVKQLKSKFEGSINFARLVFHQIFSKNKLEINECMFALGSFGPLSDIPEKYLEKEASEFYAYLLNSGEMENFLFKNYPKAGYYYNIIKNKSEIIIKQPKLPR